MAKRSGSDTDSDNVYEGEWRRECRWSDLPSTDGEFDPKKSLERLRLNDPKENHGLQPKKKCRSQQAYWPDRRDMKSKDF